ncbi:MAG: hypothetical protein HRF45_09365 [Fimbriimonadia bacterium]|jgi:hypothetical protein
MKQRDSFRDQVELLLGSSVPDEEWAWVDDSDLALECRHGMKNVNELVNWIRRTREVYAGRARDAQGTGELRREGKSADLRGLRGDALRLLLAQIAEAETEVQSFRSEVLNGELLAPEKAVDWVRERGREEGPPTIWLDSIPVPQDADVMHGKAGWYVEPPLELGPGHGAHRTHVAFLEVACPPDFEIYRHAVEAGGVLDRLRQLSEELSKDYGWAKSTAATFVLTGFAPYYSSASVTRTFGFGTGDTTRLKTHTAALMGELAGVALTVTRTRIKLELDPTLSPSEVAALYASWRSKVLGKRYRPLSAKHLTLVAFVLGRPSDEPLGERMLAWNAEYGATKGWKYGQESNFRRDFHRAKRRLLFPPYRHATEEAG